jgi:hypothetical protein
MTTKEKEIKMVLEHEFAESREEMKPREIHGQERYEDLVGRVAKERGWPPRKARRFIDSVSKKEAKKFLKKGLANRERLESEGKLITVYPESLEVKEVDCTHEECADCSLENSDPPKCKGHASGPVACHHFVGMS